jgi:chaperone LolA
VHNVSVSILSLIALATFANGQTLSPNETKRLLARVHEKLVASPNLEAEFQEQKTSHFLNKPMLSTGRVWFQSPNKFRREMKGNVQTVAVSNGRDFWIYFPSRKSAQHFTLGKNSPVDAAISAMITALNLENVESTYQVTATKSDGRYELQLLPRTPAGKRLFQRFDLRISNDLFVQQTEMVKPNGDKIVTTYSNQTRVKIPESTFEFTPPAATNISTPLGR